MESKFDLSSEINRLFAQAAPLPPAAEIDRLRARLFGIIAVYDAAAKDAKARIPTGLALAIEAARPQVPYNFSSSERRDGGTDTTAHGTPMRAGQ